MENSYHWVEEDIEFFFGIFGKFCNSLIEYFSLEVQLLDILLSDAT